MADLSYLFGGNTPASISGSVSDMGTNLPAWLQEYTRGLAGQATAVAGEAYQPYTTPANSETYGEDAGRIAGFTPMQKQAQQLAQQYQGNYQPYMDFSSNTLPGVTGNYMDQQARQLAGTSIPQVMGQYMNPYTNQVVDRMAELGQRNLSENLLPQVNQTFTGAGQFGGTRNAEFTNRALRDANESIMAQQGQLLNTGFAQQQQAANTDLQRMMQGLQAGTNAAQSAGLTDLQRYAQLAQLKQQLGYQDLSVLDTLGQQQQQQQQRNMDLAGQDFMQQVNYPKQQLSFLSDIIRGQQVGQSGYQSSYNPGAISNQLSPLAAATQGFLGARSILSPVEKSSTK